MPDHLHLLVDTEDDANLIGFVKRFKQTTGWWFRNRYLAGSLKASPASLWHKSYYDHVLRSEEGLPQVAKYIVGNPVRAGLVESPEDYPFSGSLVWGKMYSCRGGLQVSCPGNPVVEKPRRRTT
jgi:REP element-mobilizing transposase RayT